MDSESLGVKVARPVNRDAPWDGRYLGGESKKWLRLAPTVCFGKHSHHGQSRVQVVARMIKRGRNVRWWGPQHSPSLPVHGSVPYTPRHLDSETNFSRIQLNYRGTVTSALHRSAGARVAYEVQT